LQFVLHNLLFLYPYNLITMVEKEATIYDIAKKLKLSPSTVSRALNENKLITKTTRDRVKTYAESIGYQTNTFASNLRNRATKTIGVIVPKLDSKFISIFLAGAEKAATSKDYSLLISQSLEDNEREKANTKSMFKKRVDGLIVSLAQNSESTVHFNPFFAKEIPVVFFDRTPSNQEFSTYLIDNYNAGYTATKHLIDGGCRNLIHLSIDSKSLLYEQRRMGFNKAILDSGIKNTGKIINVETLDFESGKKAAQQIINSKILVDGVFATNDQIAVGCMLELQKSGIKIPDDIAFVGFNNDPICEVISPELTSINYPAFELGTLVTTQLIEHILGNSNIKHTHQTVLKSELVIRKSSLKNS